MTTSVTDGGHHDRISATSGRRVPGGLDIHVLDGWLPAPTRGRRAVWRWSRGPSGRGPRHYTRRVGASFGAAPHPGSARRHGASCDDAARCVRSALAGRRDRRRPVAVGWLALAARRCAHGPCPTEPPTLGDPSLLGWTFEPLVALGIVVALGWWRWAVGG